MNLPNYFLADLPPEATLSPGMIADACQTLKRNREQYFAQRSTSGIVQMLCNVGAAWLQPESAFRKFALDAGPQKTGFSRATLKKGLDQFFGQFTPENFQSLLEQEFGHACRLDKFAEVRGKPNAAMVRGPEFLVHIAAGNIPNPALMSIVTGLLTRSAQFVKCAGGSSFLPRLFAHSIYEAEPKLGACLEVAEWPGGHAALEDALFAEADCITATGSDETLEKIRHRVPRKARFLGYGHRVSFGYIDGEALSGIGSSRVVSRAADDIVAWNQLGCLSPHVIYVQDSADLMPQKFAELLAAELEQREAVEPRGEISWEESAAIVSRRGLYEIRAAHTPGATHHWCSKNSTAWTVIYESDARFQLSCLNRFIYIKPVRDLTSALEGADPVRGHVSTVGIAAPEEKMTELATHLARWGATRVCPLGQMQNPPLTWRHDGRPALGDLVTWTDLEF